MKAKRRLRERFHSTSYMARLSFILFFDLVIATGVPLFSVLTAYNFDLTQISFVQRDTLYLALPFFAIATTITYYLARLYSVIWSFVSVGILFRGMVADFLLLAFQFVFFQIKGVHFPISFYIIECLLFVFLTSFNRFFYRFVVSLLKSMTNWSNRSARRRALLVGAGEAGHILIRESKNSESLNLHFVAAIDDNSLKHNRYLEGVKILGGREQILEVVEKLNIEVIVLAMPDAPKVERRKILAICKQSKRQVLVMPSVSSMVTGERGTKAEVLSHELHKLKMEDLLGREPSILNNRVLADYIGNQCVLITGAGGSIGSELARQVASLGPSLLLLLDIYENGVYDVQMELKRHYPHLNLQVLIASVRDAHRVETIFASYKPQLIFHAAAHKHVPLMEFSPNEVVKNNVRGTYLTAKMAAKYGAKRFVLISTDKAVNPTNIMGASKRLCEMIIQHFAQKGQKTDFVAVRFGNVLGSNGSVIPLFKKQIEAGGPVTVTHPDITRFFMTIPEAVNLVLQAGASAKGGEIFVLDMGEPVSILELAKNMIYLSGYEPDKDIQIVFTGLRPGEKLYEEILLEEEGLTKTENNKIYIGKPLEFDNTTFEQEIEQLMAMAWQDGDGESIRREIMRLVPSYVYQPKNVMPRAELKPDCEH